MAVALAALAFVLASLLAPPWSGPLVGSHPAPAVAATPAEALAEQVLAAVNAARAEAGEPPVAADPALRLASQRHADYLLMNTDLWGVDSAHWERPDRPGYVAERSYQRAQLAGFPHTKVAEVVVSTFGGAVRKAEDVVRMWVDAPLHRRAVIERSVAHAGFGYGSDGYHRAYVLDVGHLDPYVYRPLVAQPYPAEGQTGVPVSWDGNENPQPFPELVGSYPSGYPITVFPVHGGAEWVSSSLTLRRASDGAAVPVVKSPLAKYNYAFAPRSPLQPGTLYTATFTYTGASEYGGLQTSGSITWSFTTAGGTTTTTGSTTTTTPSTTTTTPSTTTTTTTTLPPPTTTTSSTTSTSTTTTASTTSTTLPPPAFDDVGPGSPYRDAILAVATAGIVEGYLEPGGGRTFRPENPIRRQHFAKMMAEALDLPVSEADLCGFPDVDISGSSSLYPDNYVAAVAARGITVGTSVDPPRFSPWKEIRRAQVLTMVVRAARSELPGRLTAPAPGFVGTLPAGDPTHGENVRWAEANGLLAGMQPAGWDLWAPATRGEVAQILWNLIR